MKKKAKKESLVLSGEGPFQPFDPPRKAQEIAKDEGSGRGQRKEGEPL